ncbi:cell division protein FtsL [Aquibacillus halophilus]|uniref:Cell division protein FtsL n=1 Tax=Aquibacillus halophilus TaxID=930132 RepID=A0A6A8DE89_9BACI|nr:cell division protein FtsL [Aquibacillus halophilus]MRH42159.1 cell division protein FtsL [Aquibacillus halophilus]
MSSSQARNWQNSWQEQPVNPTRQTDTKQKVKVKVKKSWITTGEKFLYTFLSAVALIVLYFTVSFSATTDSLNRDVQKLESDVKQQEVQNENLQYKVKEYSNPDRILQIAKENGLSIQNTQVIQATQISN